ncbi:MAG: Hpt domain-containing protein, partial [Candidatus Omnitrophota bacterium]|nr:Hpt domain-containing protein [Candidatus Omnitrophota bacterium]
MTKQNDYKKIYIQESDELLQEMNKNLLILEKEPQNKDALNAIFRSAHTLKSMSASMGYTPIAELSHKMEDVLDQLRTDMIIVSDKVVDILFKSFDSLESMVECTQEDKDLSGDISLLLTSLDKVMLKGPTIAEEKVSAGLSLNKFEKKTLVRVKKEGYHCYYIKITLSKNCILKSVRAFMILRNLHTIGETIKSVPDSQSLEEEKFGQGFDFVFISKQSKTVVKKKAQEVLDVDKAEISEMKIPDSWDKEVVREEFLDTQSTREAPLAPGGHMRKIQSVRVDISRLDKLMNLVEELAISKLRLSEVSLKLADIDLKVILEAFNRITDDLQTEVMHARLVPVGQIFGRFPRLVRDLAKKEQKKIKLDIIGSDIELDRTVLDEIGDPMIHLLRNAIDHGVEKVQERKKKA